MDMQPGKIKHALTGIVTTICLLGAGGAYAAIDTFLKIDGIDGESQDDKNRGASDVLGWQFSLVGGGEAGKRGCSQGIEIIKAVDSASPKEIINAATGTVAPRAVLKVRKAGAANFDYLTITMSNVLISSYRVASNDGQPGLTENIVLSFESMDGAYRKQNPDGSPGTAIPWNLNSSARKCGG
jgi:type VI secretion system secreted protein Hcp